MIVHHVCNRKTGDLDALRSGDAAALAKAVAGCIRLWYDQAGVHVVARCAASHVAGLGATPQAGLLAAANDLRDLLAQSPHGRKAIQDLGLQKFFDHIEGE